MPMDRVEEGDDGYQQDEIEPRLFHCDTLPTSSPSSTHHPLYALAMHGKSRHQAAWSMEALWASNHNLHSYPVDDKSNASGFEYIVPTNLYQTLKGRLVVMRKF